jgi:hypothetical protein
VSAEIDHPLIRSFAQRTSKPLGFVQVATGTPSSAPDSAMLASPGIAGRPPKGGNLSKVAGLYHQPSLPAPEPPDIATPLRLLVRSGPGRPGPTARYQRAGGTESADARAETVPEPVIPDVVLYWKRWRRRVNAW